MTKIRLLLFLLTILIVGSVGVFVSYYARGYRFNTTTLKFSPNGLLVLKSVPDGAQIFVDGELKTATNATLPIPPGTYDVSIRKDGYSSWNKRLTIDKEIVTESTAYLFKSAPSLSAITFSGVVNPTPSKDMTKIAYVVPPTPNAATSQDENGGLWIMDTINLPLGFSRQPRRITDGDLTLASWIWSPDGRNILLTTKTGSYILDTGTFTPQAKRVNIGSTQKDETLASWEEKDQNKLKAQMNKLPDELQSILDRKASSVVFSPDENMLVFTASGSATIPDNLIPQLPGSSTQKQDRILKSGYTYVYDIKEDRNFLIDDGNPGILTIDNGYTSDTKRRLSWFPTSRHLVLSEKGKITIMDYDGTNKQIVYSGSYVAPNAYPTLSSGRLLILTNLGADSTPPNLYSLSLD